MAEEQTGRGIGFGHGPVSAAEILGLPRHPKQDPIQREFSGRSRNSLGESRRPARNRSAHGKEERTVGILTGFVVATPEDALQYGSLVQCGKCVTSRPFSTS